MTTLNARANQAYHEAVKQAGDDYILIDGPSFEEGWETGYKAAAQDIARALAAVPGEVYPEDVFPPDGTSVDCQSARVMRFAYPAAAHIALKIGEEDPS